MKPLAWAAGQQEQADRLLNDLRDLNEGLAFISGRLNKSSSILPSRILPHVWGEENLKTLVEAMTLNDPDLAQCAQFKREVLAATKEALAAAQRAGPARSSPLRLLPPRISKRRNTEHSHLIVAELSDRASGNAEPVLLEDKSYERGPQPQYEKFVEARVCEVAAILSKTPKPAKMRVLDCVGYVPNRQSKSFSLIFRFPKDTASSTVPVSLQRLLPSGPNGWDRRQKGRAIPSSWTSKPGLQTRFAMASSLTQSFSLLQACGVLHKGIAPENIIFFQDNESASGIRDLSQPFLCGFTWSRLHGSDYISDHTQGPNLSSTSSLLHSHPAYSFNHNQRYLKVFDLYSLGLVLLQVGVWRRLADIADELFPSVKSMINTVGFKLGEGAQSSASDEWLQQNISEWQDQLVSRQQLVAQSDGIASSDNPRRGFQECLVKNLEKFLLPEMGEVYTRVVARCLTGDIANDGAAVEIVNQISDEDEPEYILQDAIVKNIVEELDKCVV